MVCAADGTSWEVTEDAAAGCLFEGDFFSAGSVHAAFSAAPLMECTADGQWKVVPAE